jgi:hypothetical protein
MSSCVTVSVKSIILIVIVVTELCVFYHLTKVS